MKPRSQKQDEAAWRAMNKEAREQGWACDGGWWFAAPNGMRHDLSATDPKKLHLLDGSTQRRGV